MTKRTSTKILKGSAMAAALLAVSACGSSATSSEDVPLRDQTDRDGKRLGTFDSSGGTAIEADPAAAVVETTPEAGAEASDDASGAPPGSAASDAAITVCELGYYSGEFSSLGPSLTADIVFPVNEVINADPPLGQAWAVVTEDLGTVGEAAAAEACLQEHDADVIVSIAHGYGDYRDTMIEHWATNDGPIVPSVHGGAIPGNLGGKAAEPIFRAQGLDEGLGTSGVLYAETSGAQSVAILATQGEGFQLAADASVAAADAIGMAMLGRIDTTAGKGFYDAELEQLAALAPDAVILQAGAVDAGNIIKEAAGLGMSFNWIGETGMSTPDFVDALGAELISSQESIGYAAISPDRTTPAWEFFSEAWDSTPGYGDEFGSADDIYHFSTYDVMVHTALAVEAAGSYAASAWAPAMFEVGSAPGEVCYTYSSCLELLRAGMDIDYEGVTGSGDYTDGGVNNVTASYTPFNSDGSHGEPSILDPERSLQIVDSIASQATCDVATPPNSCEW